MELLVLCLSQEWFQIQLSNTFSQELATNGVRFHKLIYEALLWKKLEAPKQWMMATDREDPLGNLDLSDRHANEELTQAAEVLVAQMQLFDSASPDDSQVLKFWNIYLRTAQTLLSLIRAEKSGNWSLDIESLTSMLPMFYAYDRVNYSRWLPIYICDMVDLVENAPEVHKEFLLRKLLNRLDRYPLCGCSDRHGARADFKQR